jgi:hypothetical protein
MIKLMILASLLAQAPDHSNLNVGDEIAIDVTITAKIDFGKKIQWRNYDLRCKPPVEPSATTLHCVVVGVRAST